MEFSIEVFQSDVGFGQRFEYHLCVSYPVFYEEDFSKPTFANYL